MGLVDEGAEQAGTQNPPLDLGAARHNIDLLELLFEKTKGNRTPEEDQLLERLLFDVRMQYVDRTRPS
jgi:hypothetical protein